MAEGVMVSRIAEGGQADVKGMQLYDKIVKVMETLYLQWGAIINTEYTYKQ